MKWYQIEAKKDGKTVEIMIYSRIGQTWDGEGISAKQFVTDLMKLKGVENIKLYINSPGGNVFDGNAIYNALRAHSANIHVKIDGIAASIASVIAMSGDTIEMPQNAMMMIHDPSGMVWGTAEDMLKMAEALEKIKTGLVSAYGRSKLDIEQLAEMMSAETWFTAEEAMEHGLADEVTEKVNIQASLEDFSQFNNVPEKLITSINNMIQKEVKKEVKVDLETLKAKYPDLFKEVQDLARAEMTGELDTLKTENEDLKTKNGELQGKVDELTAQNGELEKDNKDLGKRVVSLEAKNEARDKNDAKTEANKIFDDALADSKISDKHYDRVKRGVFFDGFYKDGEFDKKGYTEAVDAEIKDWVKDISDDVLGATFISGEREIEGEDNDDALVDEMLSMAGEELDEE